MQTLYRFFDKDSQLLYVGITNDWKTRFHQHEKNASWWDDVVNVVFEKYETREAVEKAEKTAIATENPIWNKAYNLKYESARDHFERLKYMIKYGLYDETHAEFIPVLQEALEETHKQGLNCKPKFIAAAFIDNYGYPQTGCRNCAAISESKYFNDLAELGWEATNENEY